MKMIDIKTVKINEENKPKNCILVELNLYDKDGKGTGIKIGINNKSKWKYLVAALENTIANEFGKNDALRKEFESMFNESFKLKIEAFKEFNENDGQN